MIGDYTTYVSGNDFLNQNADVKNAETEFDYHSFYRAYVVNNSDPEKLGRVQIQLPVKESAPIWAYPGLFAGLGFQTGMMILPPIGSVVFVTFEYSDEHRPIYFGGLPTKYSPGKEQSYGPFINSGRATEVNDDDLPIEYTGTQQIIYKSPTGNIIYIDDSDYANSITIKNLYDQQFKISREYNQSTNAENNYIEMYFDQDNYLRLKDGEFTWVSNGVDVPIGNVGNATTVLWEVNT
jgi:hypothetical protein